jgi:hypothetical protein
LILDRGSSLEVGKTGRTGENIRGGREVSALCESHANGFLPTDAFHDGLVQFKSYLDACLASPSKFSGAELVEILDSFGPTLHSHLSHEPPKLASLSQYNIDMRSISEKTAQHSMQRTSTTDVLPLLWYNLDKEFENGKWVGFPEVPAPTKWVMINILGWWRGNWWRFGSSGADGVQRELLCLRKAYGS